MEYILDYVGLSGERLKMTGRTHRVGGMVCVLGGFTYLESRGMLLHGVDPILQLTVMYPFALYGSTFCDLDHGMNSMPSKDIVSIAVNRLLHIPEMIEKVSGVHIGCFDLLNAKHRSWQTHSDLFLVMVIGFLWKLLSEGRVSTVEGTIIRLIGLGFVLGVISHLILDMLTPEGIWCIVSSLVGRIPWVGVLPKKIRLVPSSKFFRTDGPWEKLVRVVLWGICLVLFVRIIYLMSPYRIVFNF